MVYECCGEKFEGEREFKKHIRSKYWHRINYSTSTKVLLNRDEVFNIIKNPKLIFGISNLIIPVDEKRAILYLPFKRIRMGTVLKRVIIGNLDGPKLDFDMLEYKFNSDKLIYEISFRLKRLTEDQTEVYILSSMAVNIGILGRIMPSEVIKALQSIVTPQILAEKLVSNIKSL
ncbi:hypothetical protein [Sulfurisphaera ohwakuensis]|uniref:Uncharacterized protein n=1 Tax=Sulfurisphaera ohwakuensis TaxID=69656 RepID=A0A650CHD9_SULOH|nr:hypothetical protein [Sulfurisphaera ohwakuensis]MBB5254808.1 hypothetical protein [Sulfurisphaera ohwakuensis]QGR17301.1 hypothetical protein D1869_08930 [Sulfurisphaera ohwakuensis]